MSSTPDEPLTAPDGAVAGSPAELFVTGAPHVVLSDAAVRAGLADIKGDAAQLRRHEEALEAMPPHQFVDEVSRIIADPTDLLVEDPARVAALVREIDAHPGWLSPETRAAWQAGLDTTLGEVGWDLQTVRTNRALAVEEIRRGQNPDAAAYRLNVLGALNTAAALSRATGVPLPLIFEQQLELRCLLPTARAAHSRPDTWTPPPAAGVTPTSPLERAQRASHEATIHTRPPGRRPGR